MCIYRRQMISIEWAPIPPSFNSPPDPHPLVFFFIHIFERQYDKKCQKVYHITFYHILKFSKSLSYPLYHIFKYIKNLLFYLIFQKLHHISFYHIIKNFIIFSLSYFNMIKRCKKCTLSYFFNMIKKCEIWIKKKPMGGGLSIKSRVYQKYILEGRKLS